MRLVFVPWDLMPSALLAGETLGESLRLTLGELNDPAHLGTDEVVGHLERLALRMLNEPPDKRGTILLVYATSLWLAGRWLDAMEIVQQARAVLGLSVAPEASYHKALADYLGGLIALSAHADDKATQLFRSAQETLEEAARYWGYGRNQERMQACHDLVRWMADLLNGMAESAVSGLYYLLPLFEEIQGIFQRVGLVVLPAPVLELSEGTLARVHGANELKLIPLSGWSVPLLSPVPGAFYCARQIVADGDGVAQARSGDVLLLECRSVLPVGDHGVFIRQQRDGRILFRAQAVGRGLNCTAKALLRRGGGG